MLAGMAATNRAAKRKAPEKKKSRKKKTTTTKRRRKIVSGLGKKRSPGEAGLSETGEQRRK